MNLCFVGVAVSVAESAHTKRETEQKDARKKVRSSNMLKCGVGLVDVVVAYFAVVIVDVITTIAGSIPNKAYIE